jgi:hypothetical protein
VDPEARFGRRDFTRPVDGQRTVSTFAAKTYPAPRSVRISLVCDPFGSIFRRRRPTCTSIERS